MKSKILVKPGGKLTIDWNAIIGARRLSYDESDDLFSSVIARRSRSKSTPS
jgi:hypothetical protein